jgi:DNA repair and recombination protein RAD54 and RAD54-like protein
VNKPFVLPVKTSQPSCGDEAAAERARLNRRALQSGATLTVKRLPFLSFLTLDDQQREQQEQKLRQPFKSPCTAVRTQESDRLLQVKTLGIRRRWSTGFVDKPMVSPVLEMDRIDELGDPMSEPMTSLVEAPIEPIVVVEKESPPPLVLWKSDEHEGLQVVVPEIVGRFLRPHQREGVQFMFDCVCQVRGFNGQGCILADDMGLGKTLQSITLMYTLMQSSMRLDKVPVIKRAIVVCPTSLVKNWDDEIIKWLHGRVKTIALFEAKRETVLQGIRQFIIWP